MIKNLVFDVGNVVVDELGGNYFSYLAPNEKSYLDYLVYSKDSGFDGLILGKRSSIEYRDELMKNNPQYEKEIKLLLSRESMPLVLPKKTDVIDLIYSLKQKYEVYFLSNIIDITYDYLSDLFNDFDGGVYSFQEGMKKPDLNFYGILLDRYNLKPAECVFFDDREENIFAAKKVGINSFLFRDIIDIYRALDIV